MKFSNFTSLILFSSLLGLSSANAQDIVLFGNVSSSNADGGIIPVHGAYVGIASSEVTDWYDYSDEAGNYEFVFEWNWDGPVAVICEAEGYESQTATIMPEGEEAELNFVLSPSQGDENGILLGMVTYQISPSGPVIPVSGASIGATPSWGPEPWFQTHTDEEGHYELELWANEEPWIVYCETEYGQQESEAIITAGNETELNFQFLGWEPDLPPPYNLTAELSNNGNYTTLHWDYYDSPGFDYVFFRAFANLNDDPENPWIEIGTTEYNEIGHYLPWPPDASPPEICYRVTAVNDEFGESDPSEQACVDLEFSDLSPPYDLIAEYVPDGGGLYGGVELDWGYSGVDPTEPAFHIYMHYGYDDMNWMLVGESVETNYLHVFGDYLPPSNESCFRVTAVLNGEESEPGNIACIYLEEPENGVVFGHVYEMSLDPDEVIPIPGAVLHFANSVIGDTWTTMTGNNGGYEISLPAGFYQTWVEAEGYQPQDDETVMVIANQEVEQNFYLQPMDDIDLTLHGFVRGQTDNPNEWIPIPGSHIRATPNDQEEPVYETNSNEEGYYELPLPSGYYDVTASHEGYQTGFAYVHIGADQENWQDFYLEISDTQNAGIHGQVYWETPNGNEIFIPGAQIRAEGEDATLVYETVTGEDGGYEMEVMANQHYVVTCTIEFEGMEITQVQETYVGISWVEMNFEFGDTEPPEFSGIHGQVNWVTPDGGETPIPGAHLIAYPEDVNAGFETYTNDDGNYEMEVTANVHYFVTCTIQFAGAEITLTQEVYVGEEWVELNFTFGEDLPMNPSITGHVNWVTADGNVIPIAGALIQSLCTDSGEIYEAETNEAGFYQMEVFPNNHYVVTCTIETEEGTFTQTQECYVGENPVWVDFTFGDTYQMGSLVGFVGTMGENGTAEPIAGAMVSGHGPLNDMFIVETDENGFFEAHNLMPFTYFINVWAEGYFPLQTSVEIPAGGVAETEFFLEPFVDGEFLLHGMVFGLELDAVFPLPGSAVSATPNGPGDLPVWETVTDEDGQYELLLPPGGYLVTAQHEGFVSETEDIFVGPNQPNELDFLLYQEGEGYPMIFGQVWMIGENGNEIPVNEAVLQAVNEETGITFDAVTNDNGHFEMGVEPYMNYSVSCTLPDPAGTTQVQEVYVENTPVELTFIFGVEPPQNGVLAGVVRENCDIPEWWECPSVGGAMIVVTNPWFAQETISDEAGHFEMPLPAAQGDFSYFVHITAAGYLPWLEDGINIYPNEVTEINPLLTPVNWESFGWLTGIVHDSNPEPFPIPNVTVVIENDLHSYETNTGETGNFEFHVPAGWYDVHASAEEYESFTGETMIYPGEEIFMEIMLSPAIGQFSEVSYFGGWNLIGVPRQTGDTQIWYLFPESIEGTLYGYDQSGYYLETIPGNGNGYWLKFWESGSASIYGEGFYEMSLELSAGWNLIAGPTGTVTYNGVDDPQGILVEGTLYRYTEGGYELSEMIAPGNGYWIKTFDSGTITLHVTDDLDRFENLSSHVTDANVLKVNSKVIYFGLDFDETTSQSFSLPPAPPEGGVDVRFSGDSKLCLDNCEILIMNPESLLEFEWDIKNREEWHLVPVRANETKWSAAILLTNQNQISLTENAEKFILKKKTSSEIPMELSILSAFPNPFNPVTTIQFSLPLVETRQAVSLQIFDITGKMVDRLIESEFKSGFHSVNWDASENPSGIYIVHLNTNNSIQTQKIVLMK